MQKRHGDAIRAHRLRSEIIATKVANRFVNRLGIVAPFELAEEEGAAFGQAAAAFVAAERLFEMRELWAAIDEADVPEEVRLALFDQASAGLQLHIADLLRCTAQDKTPGRARTTAEARPRQARGDGRRSAPARGARRRRAASAPSCDELGAPREIAAPDRAAVRAERRGRPRRARPEARRSTRSLLTRAYTKLGEALGLDWAQNAANHFQARDQWERLLTAGLARDFEQLRLEFLDRRKGDDPKAIVDKWVTTQAPRIEQFRRTVDRARTASITTAPMLAQIATQARVLLGR